MQLVDVTFNKLVVDPTSQKGELHIEFFEIDTVNDAKRAAQSSERDDLSVVFEDGGEIKRFSIDKRLTFDFKDEDNITFDIQPVSSRTLGVSSYSTYSPATMFLLEDISLVNKVKDYFSRGVEEVAILTVPGHTKCFIGEPAEKIETPLAEVKKEVRSRNEIKNKLKAYETPTNIHEISLSLFQKYVVKRNVIPELRTDIHNTLGKKKVIPSPSSVKQQSEQFLWRTKIGTALELLDYNQWGPLAKSDITDEIVYEIGDKLRTNEQVRQNVLDISQGILEHCLEAKAIFTSVKNVFPFRALAETSFGAKYVDGVTMPILDMQAGSGTAFFEAFDKSKTPAILIGTELRKIEELGVEPGKVDPRYRVINEINSMVYKGAYQRVFKNRNRKQAVTNLFTFLNPPYTSDDLVAKESVLTLEPGHNFTGLFPTKMLPFFKQEFDGYIFKVKRELTGYTDPNTPPEFLYLVGKRFAAQGHDEELGLMIMSQQARNIVIDIKAKVVEEGIIEMYSHMNKLDYYDGGYHFGGMYDYYTENNKDNHRSEIISGALENEINSLYDILKHQGKIAEALKKHEKIIFGSMSPIETIKRGKIFPDLRYYSDTDNPTKLSFKEVYSNIPLMVFYRDNYPKIFNLVLMAAESLGIEVPTKRSNTEPFRLSAPSPMAIKDKITNDYLGMMKLHYYPSYIDLKRPEDKDIFVSIIADILNRDSSAPLDMIARTKDVLRAVVGEASKMIIKTETIIKPSTQEVANQELFVLVDQYEKDIARLDVSLTDFYKEIEERGIFDISNYVELALLSSSQKQVIMSNFITYIDDILYTISPEEQHSLPIEETDAFKGVYETTLAISKLIKREQSKEIDRDEYAKGRIEVFNRFLNNFGLKDFFESQLILPDTYLEAKKIIVKNYNLAKSLDGDVLESFADKVAKMFNGNEVSFYENPQSKMLLHKELHALDVEDGDRSDFIIAFFDEIANSYTIKKSVISAQTRFVKVLVEYYLRFKLAHSLRNTTYDAIYDQGFEQMMVKGLGLKPHQFKEAERFVSISDETKLELLLWEMRSGKSRTFVTETFMLSLLHKTDSSIFLESKNITDIVTQSLESLPFIFFHLNVFVNKSNMSIKLSDNILFDTLPGETFPNVPKLLQPHFVGKGERAGEEIVTFTQNFEELYRLTKEGLESGNITIDALKEEHKESHFIDCLDMCMGA